MIAQLQQVNYVVVEPVGQVSVCVLLSGAVLNRPVTVEVLTIEIDNVVGSADGKV